MVNPKIEQVAAPDVSSAVAVAGHPIHAMLVHFPIALTVVTLGCDLLFWFGGDVFWARAALWASGAAFWTGLLASLVGLAELLLVPGIRARTPSWTHGVVAVMLLAVLAANWGARQWGDESQILPWGLFLSCLGVLNVSFAGWHGGKLVFDHGIGLMVSSKD
ncbi:MAG: DUF2231 domain-containing protein [Enhydrobacter sp.]|nr:MAG: DUF2231 domain-containing protein [Enhydrobacter sp.]